MRERLLAVWRLTVALLLYPLAFAGLIWVWWTGRPVWVGLVIIAVVLWLDRGWLVILRSILGRNKVRK